MKTLRIFFFYLVLILAVTNAYIAGLSHHVLNLVAALVCSLGAAFGFFTKP